MSRGNTLMVKIDLSDETNKRWLHPTGKPVQHNKAKPSPKKDDKEEAENKYNPSQARDDHGRWTDFGGSSSAQVSNPKTKWEASSADYKKKALATAQKRVNAMEASQAELEAALGPISEALGTKSKMGPLKKADRVAEKMVNDYGGDVNGVKDIVRSSVMLQDPAKVDTYVSEIKKHFGIDRVKNGYDSPAEGYKDVKVNVIFKNGTVGEVILLTPEMSNAKSKPTLYDVSGHDLYKQQRSTTDTAKIADLDSKMQRVYAYAESETNLRLAGK